MTDKERTLSEVVVSQACRLHELQNLLEQYGQFIGEIDDLLVCIGQPLNDSKIKYTAEQLEPLREIHHIVQRMLRLGRQQ